MKGRIAFALLIVCASVHAEIYTWVDNQGVTHFSDSPGPGAKPVQMPTVQSYTQQSASSVQPVTSHDTAPAKEIYESISITNPPHELTIRDAFGQFPVNVMIHPPLQSQDAIQILLDGTIVQGPSHTQTFQVKDVMRGEHKLVAQIVNESGTVLKSSEAITLFVMPPRIDMGQPLKPLGSGP